MGSIKQFFEFINENTIEKRFVVKKNKFQLYLGNILVSETGFEIVPTDQWFNQTYVILFELKTIEKYQGKGFAKYLLEQIFNYVKNELQINIISLIVFKDNIKALNLYINSGFNIFIDYDNSYSLVKKLWNSPAKW